MYTAALKIPGTDISTRLVAQPSTNHTQTPHSCTSWAVLMREYYIQDATTFLWLEPSHGGDFHWNNPQTDLHAQKISIPISTELSMEELREHMFESSRDASWEHWSNGNTKAVTEGHSTAVLVLNDEQVDDGTSPDAIFRTFEWLQKYGKRIKVEALRNLHSVCDIKDIVMDRNWEHQRKRESKKSEIQDLVEEFVKLKAKLSMRKRTGFCTSITGFLGSQILRTLLQSPTVGQVVGLVRAENRDLAMEKVQRQAEIAQWWEPPFQNRILILLGDLSKPQLGLDEVTGIEFSAKLRSLQ
ncbi:hypothetical protein N7520_005379 [Penicillium odoratum]|uniref:uncharacterized protein n=1 Tax=Penicillium odoratum TaxID=1167516 RepID=UPI00254714B5|nr:uncharacterized protein N7520_005379 [Penicillium odoratum]KAJ5765820.1 hypothetical protein N7520_005379 [Penicillium odoratum]